MKGVAVLTGAALLAGPAMANAGANAELQPGRYEQRLETEVMLEGQAMADTPQPPAETESICIEHVEASRLESFFAFADRAQCTLDRAVWAEGTIDIAGTCFAGDGGPAFSTEFTGNYRADGFALMMRMSATTPEVAVKVLGKILATRTGDCAVMQD